MKDIIVALVATGYYTMMPLSHQALRALRWSLYMGTQAGSTYFIFRRFHIIFRSLQSQFPSFLHSNPPRAIYFSFR